jgi:hypothetical protein
MPKRKVAMEYDAKLKMLFVEVDGVRVAQRGEPGTLHAKTWIAIEPGWEVIDARSGDLLIRHRGVAVH